MVESVLSPNLFDIINASKVLASSIGGASGFTRQEQIIRSGLQTEVAVVNQRTGKPRKSDEDLNNIISFLSNVVERIKLIRKLADSLSAEVTKANQFGSGDNAVQFDITLAYLSQVAAQTADQPNLLNSSSNDDFGFITTPDGRVVTLSWAALRTGFVITGTTTSMDTDFTTLENNQTIIFFRPRSAGSQAERPSKRLLCCYPAGKFRGHFQGRPARQHR